jgi:hypothetical protein
MGPRIGREQTKTSQAKEEAKELRQQVAELEAEVARYRRVELGEGTPLRPPPH